MIAETMERLAVLDGTWRGRGAGHYPTIDDFEYEEMLRFELERAYPMIHYEQRTLLLPSREPSHWESGFIRATEDCTIEISNSQDSGRVEVLRGRLVDPPDGAELRLELASAVLDHDPRLAETRRVLTLENLSLIHI